MSQRRRVKSRTFQHPGIRTQTSAIFIESSSLSRDLRSRHRRIYPRHIFPLQAAVHIVLQKSGRAVRRWASHVRGGRDRACTRRVEASMRSFTINKIELPFRFSYLSIQRSRRPRVSPCEPMFAAVFVRRRRARVCRCGERSNVQFRMQEEAVPSGNCRRDRPEPRFAESRPPARLTFFSFLSLVALSSTPFPLRSSVTLLHPTRALSAADAVTNYRSSGPIPTDGCPTTKIALRVHTRLPLTNRCPSHTLRPLKCWFYRASRTITMTRVFFLSDSR